MKQAVAEKLNTIFEDNVCGCEKLSITQRQIIRNILESTQWENVTEIDFFDQVKNSLEIPILLIEVERNDTKKIDTYQCFRIEANKWELSNINDIINFESLILMYKFEDYGIVEVFTKEDTSDLRIVELIYHQQLFLVEIGIYLLLEGLKPLKLRSMCRHIDVNRKNSYGRTLFQILDENGRNDAIELLLQNECEFPKSEIARNIPLVQQRLKSNKKFHKLIEKRYPKTIDNFLKENSNQRYFYNQDNDSACATAIRNGNFKLFSYLYSRGLTLTNFEINLMKKNKEFYNYFRTKTFSGLDLSNKFQILESITHITNKNANDLSVDDIYRALREIPSVNLILDILSKIRHIFIYIDYQENNLKIWPYYKNIYERKEPFIKRFFVLGGEGTKHLLGTFALEMTHFTMQLLYDNFGKPYYIDDDKSQNRFNEIVQDIRQKVSNGSINEELIKSVFDHSEDFWHSELISRVNCVFAFYGQDQGYHILKQQTLELLTFYENNVIPDLDKYLRCHFNHNYGLFNTDFHKQMEKCDKYFHESNNLSEFTAANHSENVIIKTDCVELTCLKIFQNITRCNNDQLNIDNTFFIDLERFSDNNFEIVSHLPKCELLILFDTFKKPLIPNDTGNISQYINTVGKRFILVADMKKNWSFDNAPTFKDSFKFTDFIGISEKLFFDTVEVNFHGRQLKLGEIINFEDEAKILPKALSAQIIHSYIFNPTCNDVGAESSKSSTYINRNFITTIFELDELRDEIMEKYLCEIITDESKENRFELRTKNDQLIKFPGKTLSIKDYKPLSEPMASESNKKVHDDRENEIFILSLKSSESFIIIDEEKEIEINNFSYADMETFSKNNNKFNIHWFLESDNSQHFFHHLKTFGSFDKTRSFCYREKCTIDEENLLKKLKNQKVFLIAAPAGMGKTETIKNMAKHLVENDSSIWAPVVVLRQCTEILQTFHPENSAPDYPFKFLTELLQFKSDFEEEMFKYWCQTKPNQICLFLDGADENGSEFTDIIIELIKRLSQTNIKYIIVSLRSIGKFEYEFKLETIAIEMEPLSYDDKIECLINTWEDEPEINNEIQIARRVAKHFRDFDDFLNNSLQIVLVAKICVDKLIEFSDNLINVYLFFKDEITLIEIYKKFIENKLNVTYESDEEESCDSSDPYSDDSDLEMTDRQYKAQIKNTQHQLRYAAIRVLLNDDGVKSFLSPEEIDLHKNFIRDIENWENFEGIVDGIFSGKLNFVHRTYAEYYFADFLLNYYQVWNKSTELLFFDHILVKNEFEYVRKFLNSDDGISDLLSRTPKHFQVPATLHDAVRQNIEENNTKILQYLHTIEFNLTINPSTLITKYIYNDSPNSIEKLIETIKYLVSKCGKVHLSIKELGNIKMERLNQILPYKCIELIKALLKCDLIYESDNEFVEEQLWNEAKDMAMHENNESTKLLQLFNEILQTIKINK